MGSRSSRRRALGGWLLGALLASFAILPICDLAFDCGCRWPGFGGYAHCDIHTAGPPDCPWCEKPSRFITSLLFSYGAGLLGAFLLPGRTPFAVVVLTSLAVVVAGALLAGAATAVLLGRPVLAGL